MTECYGREGENDPCVCGDIWQHLRVILLVPGDPLNDRRPDEYFAGDVAAAKELDWTVCLVDVEALGAGDAGSAVRRQAATSDRAIYRGWMVRSEHYAQFEAALTAKDVRLYTDSAQYRSAHELPGWYACFQSHTAPSVWLTHSGTETLLELVKTLPSGPAVIKDWVKSMKHYWDEAAYIPDIGDSDAVMRVAQRFLELRGDDLVGGVVVRSFERYEPGEVRSWWVDGRCVAVSAHPDTPDVIPAGDVPIDDLTQAVRQLGSHFCTVDLAKADSGQWRVIEVGDGQVSDRPPGLAPQVFLRAIDDE